MTYVKRTVGLGSGESYPPFSEMNLCPVDGRPVQLEIDTERLNAEKPDQSWYSPERPNMWRFGGLMGLDWDNPEDRKSIVSLGEGHTPLLECSDWDIAKKANINLKLKEEGHPVSGFGRNPTGSFKDRGMSFVASAAKKLGLTKLSVPTQGNAGDSLTSYALEAGFEVVVAMPDDTPMPIMGKVAALAKIHPQIHLELVQGTIREAGALLKEKYAPQGFFNVATFQEPGWRIEGKKTLGLEIAEPEKGGNKWKLPDVILYPTGGGTGVLGMWKAFAELEQLGLVGPERPKVICVQSEVTSPVVTAFEAGAEDTEVVQAGSTMATGLNVPGGVGHFKVLDIIKSSKGAALSVSEKYMGETLTEVYRKYGWWISPEGAACFAALDQALEKSLISSGDSVVMFNTGSIEKYLPDVRHLVETEAR